jgi:nickel-dependent lactate racemase
MDMQVNILCGEKPVELNVPDSVTVLEPKAAQALADPLQATLDALEKPIASRPLREIAQGRKSACIVISDITRPVPNALILPPMLQILEDAGIRRDRIS